MGEGWRRGMMGVGVGEDGDGGEERGGGGGRKREGMKG